MIQIIHLSDFHLNERNLNDWKSFVRKPFINKIKQQNIDFERTIIVCTGDLIDKGNLNFDKSMSSFDLFKEEVIDFICNELQVPINRFFIVPGNHDMVRNNDSKKIEAGNKEHYKTYDNILSSVIDILDNNDREGVRRNVPFSEFEEKTYNGIDRFSTFFGSAFKCQIGHEIIGISCLNSAWRCYDDNDRNYLILGEEQLKRCTEYIKDSSIKVAVMHHPIDWFVLEKNIISGHINADYDILLVGHVHEAQTITQTGFSGTLFTNIAPACVSDIREDSKAFSNGFTIIKYDKPNKEVDCQYFIYNHADKEFRLNSDIAENGRLIFQIPDASKTSTYTLIERCLKNIQDNFFKTMDEHIIAQKVHVIESLKEAFEMPPLTEQSLGDEKELVYLTLDEVCKMRQNICIFGTQEIGKTTLLFRILREHVDEYSHLRIVPVFIDMKEMGNKDITTCIKDFLRCSTEEANKLITENHIVLLVDNLDYCDYYKDRVNKFNNFNNEYPSIQLIVTTDNAITDIPSEIYIRNTKIPFKNLYLKPLKSYHMKNLMVKWLPKDDNNKREVKLERMVNNFCSYSLPCTAMSVSLFLWSTENSDRKPINQAVLLDIYIEIVLEKLSKENIYRDTFDYKNKCMLLARIAQEMLKSTEPNYALTYSQYIQVITDYIKMVGFDYEVNRIGEYLIERKIFTKVNSNYIKFSHSCFFQFFIAKRMEDDESFKNEVLDEKYYHMFLHELDYYTGLTRNDKNLLELTFNRFNKAFDGIDEIFEQIDVDKYFTYILKNQAAHIPVSKGIDTNKIKENRISEDKKLDFYDTKLAKATSDAIRKKIDDFNLEKLIIIMSNVLRNSEGVEDYELKKRIYFALIRNTVAWTVLYRDELIRYIESHNALPPYLPQEKDFVRFLQFLPSNIQYGLYNHLGTFKLTTIIAEKIQNDISDKKCSDVERYFSVGLYWDCQGKDKYKPFKQLISKLSNNIVQDYCLFKLLDYFYLKVIPDSPEEESIIELISRLKLKHEKLPKQLKGKIMLSLKENKRKYIK